MEVSPECEPSCGELLASEITVRTTRKKDVQDVRRLRRIIVLLTIFIYTYIYLPPCTMHRRADVSQEVIR